MLYGWIVYQQTNKQPPTTITSKSVLFRIERGKEGRKEKGRKADNREQTHTYHVGFEDGVTEEERVSGVFFTVLTDEFGEEELIFFFFEDGGVDNSQTDQREDH